MIKVMHVRSSVSEVRDSANNTAASLVQHKIQLGKLQTKTAVLLKGA